MLESAAAWLPRFLSHLAIERRLSPHTDSSYRRDLERFARHCDRSNVSDWRRVKTEHVSQFAAAEFRRNASPRSIQRRLSAVRSFFNYLLREGVIAANPAIGVQAPKARKRLPPTLDVDLMARLLTFRADNELSARDQAMMELFYSSGLRLAELIGLNREDIDLADRTARVRGKGDKTRVVPVGRYADRKSVV